MRRIAFGLALASVMMFAGCAGTRQADETLDVSTSMSITVASATVSSTASTATSSSATTASSTSPTTSTPPQEFHVGSLYFQPASATFPNGTLTRWTLDSGTHTVTIRRGGDASQEVFNAEPLVGTREYRFDRAGSYTVVCKYHGSMRADLTVQ